MTTSTLISLACLIANGNGAVDTKPLEAQLTVEEAIQAQQVIDSGACLPGRMEQLLRQTRNNQKQYQQMAGGGSGTQPTDGCF